MDVNAALRLTLAPTGMSISEFISLYSIVQHISYLHYISYNMIIESMVLYRIHEL